MKFKPRVLAQNMVGGNANEHLLNFRICLSDIVNIVCCNKWNARICRQPFHSVNNNSFLVKSMILHFEIKIAVTENGIEPLGSSLCTVIIPRQQKLWDFARNTGRQAHKTVAVFFEQITVNPRLKIKALGVRQRHHFYKIFVTNLVFYKQNEVVIFAVKIFILIVPTAWRNINFTAYNRLDALLFALTIKIHGTIHIAVVGYGKGSHPQLLCTTDKLAQTASTVKQAELRVQMKMSEHTITSLLYFLRYLNKPRKPVINSASANRRVKHFGKLIER